MAAHRRLLTRGGAEQDLDDHAVEPLSVQLPVASVDPDLAETQRASEREARLVLREDPAEQLPVAARLALLDERREGGPP